MYKLKQTNQYKKSLKRLVKQQINLSQLNTLIKELQNKDFTHAYKNHKLNGYKKNDVHWECHVGSETSDLLLIYQYNDKDLILILLDVGQHSYLFNEEVKDLNYYQKKHKKKQKGLSPFCYLGDPQKGISTFNKNMGNDTSADVSTDGGAMAEDFDYPTTNEPDDTFWEDEFQKMINALQNVSSIHIVDDARNVSFDSLKEAEKPTYTFKYEGPIYRFKRYIEDTKEPIYTDAQNEKHAATMIRGKLKKKLGLSYNSNLDIDEDKIELIDNPNDYYDEIVYNNVQEFDDDSYSSTIDGHDVYFVDGYYYVEGLPNMKFISEDEIFDYFEM